MPACARCVGQGYAKPPPGGASWRAWRGRGSEHPHTHGRPLVVVRCGLPQSRKASLASLVHHHLTPPLPVPASATNSHRGAVRPVRASGRSRAVGAGSSSSSALPPRSPSAAYSGEWDKLSMEEIDEWEGQGPKTPLLDTVNYPVHIKNFNMEQLRQLCKELRSDIVHSVSRTGGHLSSSLGVVELTVALHYVFNTPEDKIIWDVGHQAYGHKILTGRRKGMGTIRQTNGLSGEQAMRRRPQCGMRKCMQPMHAEGVHVRAFAPAASLLRQESGRACWLRPARCYLLATRAHHAMPNWLHGHAQSRRGTHVALGWGRCFGMAARLCGWWASACSGAVEGQRSQRSACTRGGAMDMALRWLRGAATHHCSLCTVLRACIMRAPPHVLRCVARPCQASQSATRVSTTPLEPATPRRRSALAWAWRSAATSR